ncbi:MAG: RDD family protein [Rhizobiaceae bacterium]
MSAEVLEGEILQSHLDDWRAFEGVRTRRVLAFCLDYIFVGLLSIPFAIVVFLLGIITFGLGFALFGILVPAVALIYVAFTLGGTEQATPGMRMMGIRLERLDGKPIDGILAIVHTVLFWAGNVLLTPLILLATLFLDRKRTVHDMLLGTIVVRHPQVW